MRRIGEAVEPASPVGGVVDVDRAGDRDAAEANRLRRREATDSIELQAEAVDRCAERWRLTRPDLRGADASRVHARQCGVLDTPPGAVGVSDLVECAGRP